jgi:MFS family permease
VPFAGEHGIDEGAAGVLLAAAAGLAIAVRIALGLRADGTDQNRLPPITLLLISGAIGYLVLASGTSATVVLGAILALGVGWGWAGLVLLATVELNREAPGTAVGMVKSGTFAGALGGPLLAGVLAEAASLEAVWVACAVLAAGGAAVIARPGPRPRPARTTPGARAPAA